MKIDLAAKPFGLDAEGAKWVNDTLAGMTEDEKIGQLFCLVAYNDDENVLRHFAEDLHAGGLMCRPMADNEELISTVNLLREYSKIPMLIAANLESGGDGMTVSGTKVGTQMQIAATGDAGYARALGEVVGAEASALGVNWAFAPVIDIDCNFRNPITATRTYGSNFETVRDFGAEYVKAVQSHGVAASVKHFPGDGCDERDQHLVTSINSLSVEDWDKTYGEVYKAAIAAGALTVMAGHIMQPAYSKALNPALKDGEILPATLSYELITGLLRGKLGFNGMVVTDASSMNGFMIPLHRKKAVPLSIAAGCDMFLFAKNLEEDFEYMREGIKDGVITWERLDEAVTRILAVKAAAGLHRKPAATGRASDVVGSEEHKAIAREVADKCITLEKNIQDLLPISPEKHRRVLFYPIDPTGFSMFGNSRYNELFVKKLRECGFEVEVFESKPALEGMFASYSEIVDKYDLLIYSAELATKSNQTSVRIEWAQPMGANVPMYINAVPTIFISLENPYHLLDVPRVKTYINTFGASDVVLDALIGKLTGRSEFKGKSPVDAFLGQWDTRL
ncbi:MAG: glycoside hydrolase family 3 protein [Clostridiales bacterium]|jgi:beta-N-acetylhexosaminidase|nr:glycoside hydrolase family 3 protein [Clostridiales bacterium]